MRNNRVIKGIHEGMRPTDSTKQKRADRNYGIVEPRRIVASGENAQPLITPDDVVVEGEQHVVCQDLRVIKCSVCNPHGESYWGDLTPWQRKDVFAN